MAASSRSVFVSYASQDAGAARCIAEALRAVGIEVWFDQSELRGGDAWDQNIRRQIRNCPLFVPIISANTQARTEGYFRLEWRLADQRKLLMAKTRPFLVPVCIDGTSNADAEAPDSFAEVHWTRLPAGDTTPAFVEHVTLLLSSGPQRSPSTMGSMGQRLAPNAYPTPVARTAIPEKSIAVLPFANLSGDSDNEYFSEGLAEEILSALSRLQGLHVVSRSHRSHSKARPSIPLKLQKVRVWRTCSKVAFVAPEAASECRYS